MNLGRIQHNISFKKQALESTWKSTVGQKSVKVVNMENVKKQDLIKNKTHGFFKAGTAMMQDRSSDFVRASQN